MPKALSLKPSEKIVAFEEPEWLFPYEVMEVGESFFFPTVRPAYAHYIIDVTSKRDGVRMKTYTVVEDGVLGVRSWRVG
jgi:hypothetical protein